ncbi:MAG TPA: hypothetical protein VJX92_09960 [Methylomirabilota bacterium]|nr:hypothetical protein [Methylomirabilota bacterium]
MTLRALLCAGFLLALPVFDFETARHSVHHLGSADSDCLLASAASKVSAVSPDRILVGCATPHLIGPAPGVDVPRLLGRPTVHPSGRAPPTPAFA